MIDKQIGGSSVFAGIAQQVCVTSVRLSLLLSVLCVGTRAYGQEAIRVPLTADHWSVVQVNPAAPKTDADFMHHEGFPQGIVALKTGSIRLNEFTFKDGTIEFDVKVIGEDMPGIQFRRQGTDGRENAEDFYLRLFKDCRASNDCIQYTPIINGFTPWDMYPQYQTQADVLDGWNHVKLLVSGHRMNVFLNHSHTPVLRIGNLQGSSSAGGIQLDGAAYFANLVITPGNVEGLPGIAIPDPSATDYNFVRLWQLAPKQPLHLGTTPSYSSMPSGASPWKPVLSDASGVLNLDREYQAVDNTAALNWLKVAIHSDSNQVKHVSLGWLGEVWVFVNGKLITQAKNFYYPESERLRPDGRLSLQNASFDIDLAKGVNEVAIALFASVADADRGRSTYGYGLEMRFDEKKGVLFTK